MMNNSRNIFVDIVKGVAIFLMLWGHCIQYCVANSDIDFFENVVFKTIYSFHMPLFMLVSGYLFYFSFSKRNIKELLIHRTQSLIQPIVMGAIFIFLVTDVLFGIVSADFNFIFNGGWMRYISAAWFLWSVLTASLVTTLICKKIKNCFIQIILFFMAIIIVYVFPCGNFNLFMYPYFVIGFYFAQYKNSWPKKLLRIKYISLPLFPILLCFFEKKHYIYITGLIPNDKYSTTEMLFIDAYRWLIGLVGSVFIITILEFIYNQVIVKRKKHIISTALSKIGKKSLQIYVLSIPLLSNFLSYFLPRVLNILKIDNFLVKNMVFYNFGFTLFLAILYAFGLFYFVILLEKLKVTKVMFGR